MKKIVLLNLGGTITSVRTQTGGLQSGSMTGAELLADIDLRREDLDLEVVDVKSIPSNEMTLSDMVDIYQAINQQLDRGVDGLVLTHGTDTMEETSYFMDLLLDTPVPVVFTGSQRSILDLGFDGHANIRDAILTACDPASRGQGVLLVFNQEVFTAQGVVKSNSVAIQGFSDPQRGPLGLTYGGRLHYLRQACTRKKLSFDSLAFDNQVYLIKMTLDFNPKIIEALVATGCQGLVIEGLGVGSVPPAVQDQIQSAINQGLLVVLTTRASQGGVHRVYESKGAAIQLEQVGVILDQNYLTGPEARLKLIAFLASREKESISELWNQY
ncbi:asparaginase [Hutsoniella sourekii]